MADNKIDILIIDDDSSLGEMLCLHFEDMNHSCKAVTSGAQAREFLAQNTPRTILLDQHMGDTTGLALLPDLKKVLPDTPVLMITGKHDMELAIKAMKAGALDYIHKPIDTDELNAAVRKALRPKESVQKLIKPTHTQSEGTNIIGNSKGILNVIKSIAIASSGDATVLIQGETGTGKDLVAQAVHEHAARSGSFMAINCSAIVENLLESELFGHEKGSFTGAHERKEGKFIAASDGTLFLDEIGEMSPNLQAKLLRVLQEQKFERVGGTETLSTNAHIIAATHRDLEKMIKESDFREDLYYRLKIITIKIPPLRERMEDLDVLVPHLLGRIERASSHTINGITSNGVNKLKSHNWPGNVRELENVLMRATATSRTGTIQADDISFTKSGETSQENNETSAYSLEDMEKEHIKNILLHTGGKKSKAAEILGISRPALDRKMKKFNL